jgi:CHASE3 domain sensor protein
MPTITTSQLQDLQDGISASLQTLQKAYALTNDPGQSQNLINQSQDLATQMAQFEKTLFAQQTLDAEAAVQAAFSSAQGLTDQLKAMAGNLEKVSDVISIAAKLIAALAQIVVKLPV